MTTEHVTNHVPREVIIFFFFICGASCHLIVFFFSLADKHEHGNMLLVTRYVDAIFANLRKSEKAKHSPELSNYMEHQYDLQPQMRAILVDWLVEVSEEYRLSSETLFLTVNYIDRYLDRAHVPKSQLQLVGITCMLIAAKYEEIYAPQVEDFCFITDNTYSRQEVLDMEVHVLGTLTFDLSPPTARGFLRRFLRAAEADATLDYLASYLCELSLIEHSMLRFEPSRVAAAAVMLALHTLNRVHWSSTLVHYTTFTPSDLQECVTQLHAVYGAVRLPNALPAIKEKYAAPRFKCVAQLVHPHTLSPQLFEEESP